MNNCFKITCLYYLFLKIYIENETLPNHLIRINLFFIVNFYPIQ